MPPLGVGWAPFWGGSVVRLFSGPARSSFPPKKNHRLFSFCLRRAHQGPWRHTARDSKNDGDTGEYGAVVERPGKRKGTTRIANRNRRCGSGSRAALIMFKCMHRMQHRIDNTKTKSISASTPPPNTIYHNSPFIIIEESSWPSFMPPPLLNAHYVSSRIAFRRTSRVTRADAEHHVRKPTGQSEHFAIGKFCEREAYGRRCLREYAVSGKLRGVHGAGARSRG